MILVPRKCSQHGRKTAHGLREAMCGQAASTDLKNVQHFVFADNGLVVATCVDGQLLCISW